MKWCHLSSHRSRRCRLGVLLIALMLSAQLGYAADEAEPEAPELAASSAADVVSGTAPAGAGSMDEVADCVRGNATAKTLMQELKITTLDSSGAHRVQEAKLYWKRGRDGLSRIFLRMEAPADLRGAAFLMIDRSDRPADMWLYLPEIRKVRRIQSRTISGSLFGTDFSYEDLKHLLPRSNDEIGERLADSELFGRAVYVIVSQIDASLGSGYSRIVSYIDKEYCVPLKLELFEDSEKRKVMTVDPAKVTREANTWIPREIVLRDFDRETESRWVVGKVEVDGNIPDRRFTQSQLEKGR